MSKSLMPLYLKKLIVFIFIAHLFCLGSTAQIRDKKFAEALFSELREDEKLVAECEQKAREYQIAKFGRVLPKVSGHCWDGFCPTSIILPYYSSEARQLRISGRVRVETIVNETGKVIYARAISGQLLLRQAAEQAAEGSSYQPKKTCGDKLVKFRWIVSYNFILN